MTAPRETLRISFVHTLLPTRPVGNVEDQQIISGRSFADLVSSLAGKLDVVGLLGMTENDAVKPVVILKLSEYSEVETLRIHLSDRSKFIGRPGHSHPRTGLHCNARLMSKTSSENLKPLLAFRKC